MIVGEQVLSVIEGLNASDRIATTSLLISLVSLALAWFAVFKGNRNASVATMVTLYDGLRQAWQRFLHPEDEKMRPYELAELVNLLELACAILNEHSFTGVSKRLLKAYLDEVLQLIIKNEYTAKEIARLTSDPKTYEGIRKYLSIEQAETLSITTPKKWYQR